MKASKRGVAIVGGSLVIGLSAGLWYLSGFYEPPADPAWPDWTSGPMAMSHFTDLWPGVAPEACAECHAEAVESWRASHHAKANRALSADTNRELFPVGARFEKGVEAYRFMEDDGKAIIRVTTHETDTVDYPVIGIIGEYPLRQFLVPVKDGSVEDGKIQATSVAWDVVNEELFDIFGDEPRMPGDYGHWLGQGMNWNANCAGCHMTGFRKNLDPGRHAYASTWWHQAISCHQCHPGAREHAAAGKAAGKVLPPVFTPDQQAANCESCHSQREELGTDGFRVGESFHDHFALTLPDREGLYFPDGQALDEVFVTGSLGLSKMGHAGITCLDCHEPHGGCPRFPVVNNALCLSCHGPGLRDATVIDPATHDRHAPGTDGSRCIDCHMPVRAFMERDRRRDHRFPTPDPILTRDFGVPNACNQCHQDKDVDWAIEIVREWYPDMDTSQAHPRRRTAWFARADQGQADVNEGLLLLATEPDARWRGALLSRLLPFADDPGVLAAGRRAAQSDDPLERQRALSIIGAGRDPTLTPDALSAEPLRAARIAGLRQRPDWASADALLADDWRRFRAANADRPHIALRLAAEALDRGEPDLVRQRATDAIGMDRNQPEVITEAATLILDAGFAAEAEAILREALRNQPQAPRLTFSLGLLLAGSERYDEAIVLLEQTVRIDPSYPRGYYNLILSCALAGRHDDAWRHLDAAYRVKPTPDLRELRDLRELARWMEATAGRPGNTR